MRAIKFVVALLLSACFSSAFAQPSFGNNNEWRFVPTFESIGVYWSPSGKGATVTAQVQFKPAGAPEGDYRFGYELWYDGRTAAPSGGTAGEYRGSLVELQPGTTYDIKLTLSTGGSQTINNAVTTWSENFSVPATHVIELDNNITHVAIVSGSVDVPGSQTDGGTQTVTVPSGGSSYTLLKASATANTVNGAGTPDSCIRIAAGVHHVIIRGLVLQNCARYGIKLDRGGNTRDIVIEDNEITDWGSFGNDQGRPHMPSDDGAIFCDSNENQTVVPTRIIVQRNSIHDPKYPATYWHQANIPQPPPAGGTHANEDPEGHPRGAHGLFFNTCGTNHVIRYNDIYSATNHFHDGLSGGNNQRTDPPRGFPWADSDLYGNRISQVFDDGIEAEGANRNVRIWANYIDRTFSAIGNVINSTGPLYVWRNVTHNMAKMRNPTIANADTDGRTPFLKGGLGGDAENGPGPGRAYFFHNTLLQPPASLCQGVSNTCGAGNGLSQVSGPFYNIFSYNNIWHVWLDNGGGGSLFANCPLNGQDCAADHDLYNNHICYHHNGTGLGCDEVGLSNFDDRENWHGKAKPIYAAGGGNYPVATVGTNNNAIPGDYNGWSGNFKLQTNSLGTQSGNAMLLNNFNDQDTERHIGAQRANQNVMKFGRAAAPEGGTLPSCSGQRPTAVLAASPLSGPVGVEVDFGGSQSSAVSPATISTYSFTYGDGGSDSGSAATRSHTYTTAGQRIAKLTVTDSNGCESLETPQSQQTITVQPPPGGGGGTQTITLQRGASYDGMIDTRIWAANPDNNAGGFSDYQIARESDTSSALIRFAIFQSDGGPVPDGATIISATLSLYHYSGPAATIKASRLLKSWAEPQATWNIAATGLGWTTAGANSSGSDYLATPDGQGTVGDPTGCSGQIGPETCWLKINVTSGVQAFAGGTANHGWKIAFVSGANDTASRSVVSSENGGWPTLRPKLSITYTTDPVTQVTLQRGLNSYDSMTDTRIWAANPNNNAGGFSDYQIARETDTSSALVRFGIFQSEGGPVPNGSTIHSATLSFYHYSGPAAVIKASRALKAWDESQATWNIAATSLNWTAAGANSAGSDYAATPDGQGSVGDPTGCSGQIGPETCWLNIDVTSGVQAFAGGTSTNYGWKIAFVSGASDTASRSVVSSENGGWPTLRPKLTIQYSAP